MKLVVFGAAGQVGQQLTQQALQAGHEVTAFVRNPARLTIQHPNLRIVQGDIRDAAAVDAAVVGQDALLLTVGHSKDTPRDTLRLAARNVLAAMNRHGVRRVVTLLGAGVHDERDPASAGRAFMLTVMKLLQKDMLIDAQAHADAIRDSGVAWTIVRPPRLTNGPLTGQYRVGYMALGPGAQISRADVADFMLKQVTDKNYFGKAPMISY